METGDIAPPPANANPAPETRPDVAGPAAAAAAPPAANGRPGDAALGLAVSRIRQLAAQVATLCHKYNMEYVLGVVEREGGATAGSRPYSVRFFSSSGLSECMEIGNIDQTLIDYVAIHDRLTRLAERNTVALERFEFKDLTVEQQRSVVMALWTVAIPKQKHDFPFNDPDSASKVADKFSWWPSGVTFRSPNDMAASELSRLFAGILGGCTDPDHRQRMQSHVRELRNISIQQRVGLVHLLEQGMCS
jgi:hypothetical protein